MSVNDLIASSEERPALVRFELKAVKDPKASLEAGHYVSRDEEWVLVSALGSVDIFPKRVDRWFIEKEKSVERGRTPVKHLEFYRECYARWKKGLEPPVNGTSIKDWNAISPAQCDNMLKVGIRTIEDMAQATDEAMRRVGMGAQALRMKANAWLKAAKDHGLITMELEKYQNENKQLQGTVDSLQEQIKLLQIRIEGQAELIPMAKSGFPINSTQVHKPATPEQIAISEEEAAHKVRQLLIEEYESKFGKKPHHRMKDDTIRESLR